MNKKRFLSLCVCLFYFRGAVCFTWRFAGASAKARWQNGAKVPEQEHHCCAGGQADAEPNYQAGLSLSAWSGYRSATHALKKKKENWLFPSSGLRQAFWLPFFCFSSCSWQIERPSMWYSPGIAALRSMNWWLSLLEREKCRCQMEMWGVKEARGGIRMLCLCVCL